MSDKRVHLMIDVLVGEDTDAEDITERVFNFLASDPENLFPEITEVETYDYQVESRG